MQKNRKETGVEIEERRQKRRRKKIGEGVDDRNKE